MSRCVRDAVIVGGGPVGCAAAIAMADAGLDVAVVEATDGPRRAPDSRTLALSWNSRLILQRLGVWSERLPSTAIKTIHVSHRGHFGRACLSATDLKLPALGYVLRFSDVYDALRAEAMARAIDYCSGFKVGAINTNSSVSEVHGQTRDGGKSVQARVVVVADGGTSLVPSITHWIHSHDYGQVAIVGLVRPDRLHQYCAYERFTASGPIALLPCAEEFAFVWTCTPERAALLASLDDIAFASELRDAFGDRVGKLSGARLRSSFPLRLRVVRQPQQTGIILLGNAAQTLHPIAGQGFNVGLRDAWDLADIIGAAPPDKLEVKAMATGFRRQRCKDRTAAITLTHGLAKLFSNDLLPFAIGRGVGLAILDSLPPIKRDLTRRMIFGTAS